MATYLDLVNLAIRESGMEQNELNLLTWESDAGRRIYPKIKNRVRQEWKLLQMERNEWEFGTREASVTILPRLIASDWTTPPDIGMVYIGEDSGLRLTVLAVYPGPVEGTMYVDFASDGSRNRAKIGEAFIDIDGQETFLYQGRGTYPLRELDELMREPHWDTFVGYQGSSTPTRIAFIPWDNWLYKELSYTSSTRSAPSFVSQNFNGDLTFYPQTLSPFNLQFVYSRAPQELILPTDVPRPDMLPAEYHDWIAWRAIASMARYDKNPDLLAYADRHVKIYRARAERNLMPIPRWSSNEFNR
jgi:hypothetical protein